MCWLAGSSWIPVPEHTTFGTGQSWQTVSFQVGDYVTPTANVQVRFSTGDLDSSITEAGIDNFQVDTFICPAGCTADVSGDGAVDVVDMVNIILAWGACGGCPEDVNGDDVVDVQDLVEVVINFGPCL